VPKYHLGYFALRGHDLTPLLVKKEKACTQYPTLIQYPTIYMFFTFPKCCFRDIKNCPMAEKGKAEKSMF
jgi:hypothetical protein